MRILFFCCLFLAVAAISRPITIQLELSRLNTTLQVDGFNELNLSASDQAAFGITEEHLKRGIEAITGRRPDFVSLGSWTDRYNKNNWLPVKKTLKPYKARVVNIASDPVIISRQRFVNRLDVPATFKAGIASDMRSTVATTWSDSKGLNIGARLSLGLTFLSVSGEVTYTTTWGKSTYEEFSTTVSSNSDVTVVLAPREQVEAVLSATRGKMEIQVSYATGLKGDVAFEYTRSHRGRRLWRQDVNTVLKAVGVYPQMLSTQLMKIMSYSEAKVVLVNCTSMEVIEELSGDIRVKPGLYTQGNEADG